MYTYAYTDVCIYTHIYIYLYIRNYYLRALQQGYRKKNVMFVEHKCYFTSSRRVPQSLKFRWPAVERI